MSKASAKGEERGKKGSRCCQTVTQPLGCSQCVPQTPLQPPDGLVPAARETQLDTEPRKHAAHLTLLQNQEGFSCLSSSKAGQGSIK